MIENFSIEEVQPSELEVLQSIARRTFVEAFADQNTEENMRLYLDHNLSLEAIGAELLHPHMKFFFARVGGEVAGYLKLNTGHVSDAAPALEIERLYILRNYQRRGLGRAMMHFSEQYARKMNMQRLWLGVWEHNHAAMAFYREFNLERFGEHVFMLGYDAQTDFLLQKFL